MLPFSPWMAPFVFSLVLFFSIQAVAWAEDYCHPNSLQTLSAIERASQQMPVRNFASDLMLTNLTGLALTNRIERSRPRNVSYVDTEKENHASLVSQSSQYFSNRTEPSQTSVLDWSRFMEAGSGFSGRGGIVNMSLHLGSAAADAEAITDLIRTGSTVVISAGNNGHVDRAQDQAMGANNDRADAIVVGSVDPRTGFVDVYSQGSKNVTILAPVGQEMLMGGAAYKGTSYAAPQVTEALGDMEAILGQSLTTAQHKALLQNASLKLLSSDSGNHGAGMLNYLKMSKVAERIASGAYTLSDIDDPNSSLYKFSSEADALQRKAMSTSSADERKSLLYQALLLDQNSERSRLLLENISATDSYYQFFESLTQIEANAADKKAYVSSKISELSGHQAESAQRMLRILDGELPLAEAPIVAGLSREQMDKLKDALLNPDATSARKLTEYTLRLDSFPKPEATSTQVARSLLDSPAARERTANRAAGFGSYIRTESLKRLRSGQWTPSEFVAFWREEKRLAQTTAEEREEIARQALGVATRQLSFEELMDLFWEQINDSRRQKLSN